MPEHLRAQTPRASGLAIAGSLALVYGLTVLLGAWAAYARPAAWARLGLIVVGLGLMLLLAWAGGRWGDGALGPVALGCAGAAAALGVYFLLNADREATGVAGKLPALRGP